MVHVSCIHPPSDSSVPRHTTLTAAALKGAAHAGAGGNHRPLGKAWQKVDGTEDIFRLWGASYPVLPGWLPSTFLQGPAQERDSTQWDGTQLWL